MVLERPTSLLARSRKSPLKFFYFCRSHISMELRINSSDGLVLYATTRGRSGAMMSLGLSDGHLLLLLDGGRRKVSLRSRRKYNDDQWHTVRSSVLWHNSGGSCGLA